MSHGLVYQDSLRATSFWAGKEKGECVCIMDCDEKPDPQAPSAAVRLTAKEVRALVPALQDWLRDH